MSYELLNDILLVFGGILCGILFGFGIAQFRSWRRMRKLDRIQPTLYPLGFDPDNPINRNSRYHVERGEQDENGFIRLW